MQIKGKTAVVTGGASGIGLALSRALTEGGARVCIADLDADGAREAAEELGGLGLGCDVTFEDQIASLVATASQQLGPIDIFVSNAGMVRVQPGHAASAGDDVWQANWSLHVMAHVHAARALLPDMLARGSGYFINVASAAGLLNQIGDSAYSATKHAAVSFAESLAIAHGDAGIGVSVVCPQYVATPLIGLADADADASLSLLKAEQVAQTVLDAVAADRFLVLPHGQVRDYAMLRAEDHDRWIAGMRKLRRKALAYDGGLLVENLYRLV